MGSLLDTGKIMHQLTGYVRLFCENSARNFSEKIDIVHANEMEQIRLHANEARLREEAETSCAMGTDDKEQFNQPNDNSFVDESLNTNVNRAGMSRMTTNMRCFCPN